MQWAPVCIPGNVNQMHQHTSSQTAVSNTGAKQRAATWRKRDGSVAELTLLRLVDRFSVIQDGLQSRLELGLSYGGGSRRANDLDC